MQKMGKRKKQIITQFAVEMLILAVGIIIGFLVMLAVAFIVI